MWIAGSGRTRRTRISFRQADDGEIVAYTLHLASIQYKTLLPHVSRILSNEL